MLMLHTVPLPEPTARTLTFLKVYLVKTQAQEFVPFS